MSTNQLSGVVAVQCLPARPTHPCSVLMSLGSMWQRILSAWHCMWSATNAFFFFFTPIEEIRPSQSRETSLSEDEWKVLVLTGNTGTRANVTLWVYGDEGVTGPISLSKDSPEQLFLPRQQDEFQVNNISSNTVFSVFQRYFYNTEGYDCVCMCVL